MKNLITFENFNNTEINLIIDVSSTMKPSDIEKIPELISCDGCNEINVLLVDHIVRKFQTISDLSELGNVFKNTKLGTGGTDLQAGIQYIIDNNLEQYKTYIVSDFYFEPLDYSQLSEYEEIKI